MSLGSNLSPPGQPAGFTCYHWLSGQPSQDGTSCHQAASMVSSWLRSLGCTPSAQQPEAASGVTCICIFLVSSHYSSHIHIQISPIFSTFVSPVYFQETNLQHFLFWISKNIILNYFLLFSTYNYCGYNCLFSFLSWKLRISISTLFFLIIIYCCVMIQFHRLWDFPCPSPKSPFFPLISPLVSQWMVLPE